MLTPQLEYTVNDKGTVVSISQVIKLSIHLYILFICKMME